MVKRPPAGTIPDSPGSYQFKDAQGRVIYVGKASSLRQRLSNYFGDPRNMHPRTAQMVATAESVEWTTVRNEVEALMLEYSLIKEHEPRFNVRLRDDKSYPFLAVTVDEQWPRALVMRGRKRKGTRYFGPYAHAYAIRDTLDELLRSFPIRTCSPSKFRQHERLGRPCLLFHIEKCSGPCVGEIDEVAYRQLVDELCDFLDGDTDPIVKRLDAEMRAAATELEFEKAARLRDRLATVRRAIERQQMVADRNEDIDVIGLAEDELEASGPGVLRPPREGRRAQGVRRRQGRGAEPRRADRPHPRAPVRRGSAPGRPQAGARPVESDDLETYEEWLSMQRGSRVQIRVPQRGDKRALLETVTRNAQEEFTRHRLRRASDHNTRSRALTELQQHLGAARGAAAHRVLRHGPPPGHRLRRLDGRARGRPAEQAGVPPVQGPRARQRRLRGDGGGAHPAADGLPRRARQPPLEHGDKPGRFAYPPQLLVVDGGKGQLGVAERVVRQLGLEDEIPVAGLAKRFEEVYVPGRSEPVEIPRGSEALFMLQRIRDEAHRFANTFHGERRQQADDGERPRRHRRARRDPQEAAGQGARRRQRRQAGRAGATLQEPDRGCRDIGCGRRARQVPSRVDGAE